jgi:hypothetical protein
MGNVLRVGMANDWHEVTDWIFIETNLGKVVGQFSFTAFSECDLLRFKGLFTFSGRNCPIELRQTTD